MTPPTTNIITLPPFLRSSSFFSTTVLEASDAAPLLCHDGLVERRDVAVVGVAGASAFVVVDYGRWCDRMVSIVDCVVVGAVVVYVDVVPRIGVVCVCCWCCYCIMMSILLCF